MAGLDPVSAVTGRRLGIKLALDTWLRLGTAVWLNVDGSWTTVHETANVRARLGTRVWRDLSIGLEAASLSDVNQETRRAGVFLRYAWERGEISVGGGLSGQTSDAIIKNPQPYAGATVLTRF